MSRTVEDTMKYVRKDKERFGELHKKTWGRVRGLGGDNIRIRWGLSDHFKKHQLVELTVEHYEGDIRKDISVVVPAQELQHYLRMT